MDQARNQGFVKGVEHKSKIFWLKKRQLGSVLSRLVQLTRINDGAEPLAAHPLAIL